MENNIDLEEILAHTDSEILKQWVLEYAREHSSFEQLLRENFSPENIQKETAKNYPKLIRAAFHSNPIPMDDRFRRHEYYDFDAESVRADLEKILEDVSYFLQNNNVSMAIQICKDLIEIIPGEWADDFDRDGDVQVMYDAAIDHLEKILESNLLSKRRKRIYMNGIDKKVIMRKSMNI